MKAFKIILGIVIGLGLFLLFPTVVSVIAGILFVIAMFQFCIKVNRDCGCGKD